MLGPMSTPPLSMALFALAAAFGALGQFLYKSGAAHATGGLASWLVNARIWGGVACYVAVMVLFVRAFKNGGALSTLYPIYASTFVWAALIGWMVDGTAIKPVNVLGMGLLFAGMWAMGR
jgi:multidrug transporter EmrE-like cation transporter